MRLGRGDDFRVCAACQDTLPWAPNTQGSDVYAAWLYQEEVRKAIHRFKFNGATSYARTFGIAMARCVKAGDYDAVAWVPCSFIRSMKRRYDQSRLLAVEVARALDRPLVPLLVRRRNSRAQYRAADSQERRDNVRDAFTVRAKQSISRGFRVLLVDDIHTTGATFMECKRVLAEAGVAKVVLLTAARKKTRKFEMSGWHSSRLI